MILKTSLILCLVLKTLSVSSQITDPYRLSRNVLPYHYDINLTPHVENKTFSGEVAINFTIKESNVDKIVLTSKDLDVELDEIRSDLDVWYRTDVAKYELITFYLQANMTQGNHTMYLFFSGNIQESMEGFYTSTYEMEGVKRKLGTTMAFPTNARSIFPCFDEPQFKANIQITINCPTGYSCISNMKSQTGSETGVVKYYPTPMMSTYLIAFLISDFVVAEGIDSPRQFRILTRPQAANMSKYAFQVGQDLVNKMEIYTGIKYFEMDPNIKMDHVAIPDFPAGAMENWGLIMYREDYLLFDSDHSSLKCKQDVASSMAHEISHMWFGDLVTYSWFNTPWMSEAFGRYYEYYLTEMVETFGMEDQFITDQIHTSLKTDSNYEAKPLTAKFISNQADILSHFGVISYNKGASILRMMEHWIGHEDYTEGLKKYLNTNKYTAVVPNDFFAALEEHADVYPKYGVNVTEMMTNWTEASGYPLVTVSIEESTGNITFRQVRYTTDILLGGEYPIPITYTTESTADFENTKPIFIQQTYQISIRRPDKGWVIANIQQTGFYRVRYEGDLLDLLIEGLNNDVNKTIHRYNKAQIVDDAINIAANDMLPINKMFDLVQFLQNETDYAPWAAAYTGFSFLLQHFGDIGNFQSINLQGHLTNLMFNVVGHVEAVNESYPHLDRLNRINTINFAASLGNQYYIGQSKLYLWLLELNGTEVAPDDREYVYCNGLRYGNTSEYNFLWNRYIQHNVASEKSLILKSLGCTRIPEKLNEFLMETISEDSKIRGQDHMNAFKSVLMGNMENIEIAFMFLVNNTQRIKEVYGSSIVTMAITMSSRMSENQLERLEVFVNSTPFITTDEKQSIRSQIVQNRRMLFRMMGKANEVRKWIDIKYNSAGAIEGSIIMLITMFGFLITN